VLTLNAFDTSKEGNVIWLEGLYLFVFRV